MSFAKYVGVGVVGVAVLVGLTGVGSYNGLVSKEQGVEGAWAQVETQYQRRSDLIPNLVETVKGESNFEKSTLTDVINARANATKVTIDAKTIDNPEKFAQYQQAQAQVGSALARLMAVAENYPNLKSNQQYAQLMDEIAGTENRIAVARRDFNKDVQAYNTSIKTFPTVIVANMGGFTPKAYFESDKGAEKAPKVSFWGLIEFN